jgi:hypothetical protein
MSKSVNAFDDDDDVAAAAADKVAGTDDDDDNDDDVEDESGRFVESDSKGERCVSQRRCRNTMEVLPTE